jgi:hypothetical protein
VGLEGVPDLGPVVVQAGIVTAEMTVGDMVPGDQGVGRKNLSRSSPVNMV